MQTVRFDSKCTGTVRRVRQTLGSLMVASRLLGRCAFHVTAEQLSLPVPRILLGRFCARGGPSQMNSRRFQQD